METTICGKRCPRTAGSVTCDEPETGRRWATRSLQWHLRGFLDLDPPAVLELDRRNVSEGRMYALGIVIPNVLSDRLLGVLTGGELLAMHALDLECAVERFHGPHDVFRYGLTALRAR